MRTTDNVWICLSLHSVNIIWCDHDCHAAINLEWICLANMVLSRSRVICWLIWTLFLLECSRPIASTASTVTDCPMRFPYAYFNGKYCCLFDKEKTAYQYRGAYDDALCDGANMTIASECCLQVRNCLQSIAWNRFLIGWL